jgi:hypothetical protein
VSKVAALGRRLVRLSSHVRVVGVRAGIEDLDDAAMRRLTHQPLPHSVSPGPVVSILCGFTDSFAAQARVNRLGLHLGVPMIAAQVYREGRGAEVTFSVPGLTPACGRCVTGSRYRAFAAGFRNDVGSAGSPLWATTRLNALKEQITLAIIHGTTPGASGHPGRERYRRLLERIGDRNLVQVRLDPDIATTLGLTVFDRAFGGGDGGRLLTDDVVWLPQQPESPATGFEPCGDCGGGGDLAVLKGTFADTRRG